MSMKVFLFCLTTAALWAAALAVYGVPGGLPYCALLSLLLCASVGDMISLRIPDKLNFAGAAMGIGYVLLIPQLMGTGDRVSGVGLAVFGGLAGAALLFLPGNLGVPWLPRIGLGDVKHMLLVGVFLGVPGVMFAIVGAIVAFLFVASLAVLAGRGRHVWPLGPFLATAAAAWVFYAPAANTLLAQLIAQ